MASSVSTIQYENVSAFASAIKSEILSATTRAACRDSRPERKRLMSLPSYCCGLSIGRRQTRGQLRKCTWRICGKLLRGFCVVHVIKLRRRPVYMKLENVEPSVMAGEVMPQLRLDGEHY
jgi:hypothetical protein